MNDAGKVAFTPKGDYSSTVTYEYLDTVVYNGNAYAALKTTTGNAPTDSDTDENWKLLARGGESVPMASDTNPGVVKASSDIGVSDDGSMILETDYTSQESLAELTSGESRTTFFGKIAKAVSTLISHVSLIASSSVRGHVKLSNSSSITVAGEYALDATEKNASVDGTLANQIGTINTNLTNHETSADHDSRYYTKAETDARKMVLVQSANDSYNFLRLYKDNTTGAHIMLYTRKIMVANASTVITINSGHRPSSQVIFQAMCNHKTSGIGIGQLAINTDGSVILGSKDFDEELLGSFVCIW